MAILACKQRIIVALSSSFVAGVTMASQSNAPLPTAMLLPDGQITSCFPKWLVQPLLQKYFVSRLTQISCISPAVSSHRGAIARRHERGAGCGGRGQRT